MTDRTAEVERIAAELRKLDGVFVSLDGKRTDTAGCAAIIGRVAERTVRKWRADELGPAYHVTGGTVTYAIADVLDYIASRRRDPRVRRAA